MRSLSLLILSLCVLSVFTHETACETGVFDVNITIDSNPSFPATFNAKLIKLPVDDSLRGWVFAISKPSDLVKSIFIESGDDHYLAYRSLTSTFQGNNIIGDGKSISVIYSSDLKDGVAETHSIKVQFEYDADWDVITDLEFNNVLNWLNANKVARSNYVSALKQSLSAAASFYVTNSTNSALAGKSWAEITAKIQDLRKQIDGLNKDTLSSQSQINDTRSRIAANEDLLQAMNKDLSDQTGKLVQLSGQLGSQKETLVSLKNSKDTGLYNKDSFDNAAKVALQNIAGLIGNYRAECVVDGWWLDKALADLQKNKLIGSFESSVRKALLP